jgi:hypothetical protein
MTIAVVTKPALVSKAVAAALVAGVGVSPVESRAAVGGGDCFDSAGCDNAAVGGFKMDPLDRAPVTNPGDY